MAKKFEDKRQRLVISVHSKETAEAAKAACAYWRGYSKTFIQEPTDSSSSWDLYAEDSTEIDARVLTHIADGVYFMLHEYQPVTA